MEEKNTKNIKKKYKNIKGKYFRLVIPNLTEYGKHPWDLNKIKKLKESTLQLLVDKESKRGLEKYSIAVQKHISGYPHLDILLIYNKRIENSYKRYDYIIKHGDIRKYRSFNKAILDYNLKEDKNPLKNFNTDNLLLKKKASKKSTLYELLEKELLKDPFNFDPNIYIHENDLNKEIIKTSGWPSVIRLINIKKTVMCNNILQNKSGIKLITEQLIKKTLNKKEYKLFKSWKGYQKIVDYINQIPKYGCQRPHKTKNLFIYGPPNIGKSSLAIQIEKHCSVYPLGTKKGWFPSFKSYVYKMMVWDEFNLKCYPYPDLLKLLEGRPMELPIKGGHAQRRDNQLIYMNSNCSLKELIRFKFKTDNLRTKAWLNLNARIDIIQVFKTKPLFLLCKLIQKKELFE